jgi:hypothetical protein
MYSNVLVLPKHQIYFHLGHASQCIEKYDDAAQYFNDRINSCLEAHHKGEIDELDVLTAFESQIESLVESKRYDDAMRIMNLCHFYKLNSNEVGDVFGLFLQLKETADNLNQRDKRLFSRPSPDLTQVAQILYKIGQMCQLKCEILKGMGEPIYCGYWSIVPFMVFNHQIRNLTELVVLLPRMMEELVRRSVLSTLTYATYSEDNHLGRSSRNLAMGAYKILWTNLCCNLSNDEIKNKGPRYMIESSRKRFSINLDELIVFIKYFIDHCSTDDAKNNITEAHGSLEVLNTYKRSIMEYKNSLFIINHFKKNLDSSLCMKEDCK